MVAVTPITELFSKFKEYKQRKMFVVGTGPSLANFDFNRLEGETTIAVNDAVFQFDPTIHLYSDTDIQERYCDYEPYWNQKIKYTNDVISRPADWSYAEGTWILARFETCEWMLNAPKEVFRPSLKPRVRGFMQRGPDVTPEAAELWCRNTVAATAVQLAWKLGAEYIYLLGVDGYTQGGKEYCYEEPNRFDKIDWMKKRAQDASDFEDVIKNCLEFGPCPQVFNLNPESLIGCFPRIPANKVI